MASRYFLDKLGAKTFRARGRPGGGHLEIGREVLTEQGESPAGEETVYSEMFRLGFMRVVEAEDLVLEIEYRGRLSAAQKRFVAEMRSRGWSVNQVTRSPRKG